LTKNFKSMFLFTSSRIAIIGIIIIILAYSYTKISQTSDENTANKNTISIANKSVTQGIQTIEQKKCPIVIERMCTNAGRLIKVFMAYDQKGECRHRYFMQTMFYIGHCKPKKKCIIL
jgi:hypothetical protein